MWAVLACDRACFAIQSLETLMLRTASSRLPCLTLQVQGSLGCKGDFKNIKQQKESGEINIYLKEVLKWTSYLFLIL